MKKLFIVGGGGFAREVYMQIKYQVVLGEEFEFGGFLGHAGYGHSVDYKNLQHHYKGEVADYAFEDEDYCIIGAGGATLRQKIFDDVKALGASFTNFISQDSLVDDSADIGEGNIIINSIVTVNVTMGNANLLNSDVILGHDCHIGDFNFFGPRSQALGRAEVGNNNSIGANALLLPNCKVGNGNKIGPLSAVYKGCKNNGYYVGNPAIKMGAVEQEEA